MEKIIFFTEKTWVFGSIHNSLEKMLYEFGISCEILDFFTEYSRPEFNAISQNTDYFVTNFPSKLVFDYGVDPGKIIFVAHAQWDLLLTKSQLGLDVFNRLRKYGVVSSTLEEKSREFQIQRIPDIVTLGIEFDRFYMEPHKSLKSIGFGGVYSSGNFAGEEIKRGRLVTRVAEESGIPLITPVQKLHYLAMPSYYSLVDCVMMASMEEGAGFPLMEAAAAGRLCIGTPVGYFRENSKLDRGGFFLPIEEESFVMEAKEILNYYKNNDSEYIKKCKSIQEFAREHYDWKFHIENWANFLS